MHSLVRISFSFGLMLFSAVWAQAEEKKVTIVTPPDNAYVKQGPVQFCMEVEGLVVEPGSNGVNEGKGHHHILFNSLPEDLSRPIGKKEAIHMGKGDACITLNLTPGKHAVIALFADGNHVPYNPPISHKILITVEK